MAAVGTCFSPRCPLTTITMFSWDGCAVEYSPVWIQKHCLYVFCNAEGGQITYIVFCCGQQCSKIDWNFFGWFGLRGYIILKEDGAQKTNKRHSGINTVVVVRAVVYKKLLLEFLLRVFGKSGGTKSKEQCRPTLSSLLFLLVVHTVSNEMKIWTFCNKFYISLSMSVLSIGALFLRLM